MHLCITKNTKIHLNKGNAADTHHRSRMKCEHGETCQLVRRGKVLGTNKGSDVVLNLTVEGNDSVAVLVCLGHDGVRLSSHLSLRLSHVVGLQNSGQLCRPRIHSVGAAGRGQQRPYQRGISRAPCTVTARKKSHCLLPSEVRQWHHIRLL